jgi:prephenate dehydratase
VRAAFQGEPGAFSEEVALRFFGAGIEAVPCRSFEDLFAAVAGGATDAAVVPIENTLAGSVIKNYDLLVEHDLTIVGEVVLRVVHNLIARPGATLAGLRRVHSHPVALAQCESFLRQHPALEVVPAYDTAGSVKMIMEGGRADEGAIASASAARRWGAEIVAAGIESNPQNFTRFFIVTRPDRAGEIGALARAGERKTSIVFRIANQPGGLHLALAAFAQGRIDLAKIESRPIPGRPWEYSFYLDFMGHPADPPVAEALRALSAMAESVRVLGTYPRAEG